MSWTDVETGGPGREKLFGRKTTNFFKMQIASGEVNTF